MNEKARQEAIEFINEIKSALERGVKHFRVSDNKLLETPKEIIHALLTEKEILYQPINQKGDQHGNTEKVGHGTHQRTSGD